MAERKVLNKYIKPDHDYKKINNKKPKGRGGNKKVRLMAPFSMQCSTCNDYIYKGKKFNARKENAESENYLGVQILRFYIRCPTCAAEITFKTDPEHTDYVADRGAVRNFEPWHENEVYDAEITKAREDEEENNPMKALENRTMEAKREMDILDALDEIRTKNAMGERVDAQALLARIHATDEEILTLHQRQQLEEDEKLAKSIFTDGDGDYVRRIIEHEYEDDEVEEEIVISDQQEIPGNSGIDQKALNELVSKLPVSVPKQSDFDFSKPKKKEICNSHKRKMDGVQLVILKKKKDNVVNEKDGLKNCVMNKPLGLLGNYGGDSDSD